MGLLTLLASLAFFASLALNLIVQFGLGIREIAGEEKEAGLPFFQAGVFFIAVLILWFVFSYLIVPLSPPFFEYFLFFPVSAVLCIGLETASERFFPQIVPAKKLFSAVSAYNGLALTALVLTLHLATSAVGAFVIALGFSAGILLSILILKEIRKRSFIEAVPPFLRGKPLMLISIGFLSLIFTATTTILLTTLIGV